MGSFALGCLIGRYSLDCASKLMTTISAYSLPRLFVGNIPLFVRTGKALLKRSAGF